jgi:hypothetical protein
MLPQQPTPSPRASTPTERIIKSVFDWRNKDKDAIAAKGDRDAQRAEYRARNEMREAVDVAQRKQGDQP